MIEVKNLNKRYGGKTAVNDLTFTVQPGLITGFLGPNGAGKSTTMRVIAGLDRPAAGTATVNGKPYPDWPAPLTEVGILLEAGAIHPGLPAGQYLRALGATHGIGSRRVMEVAATGPPPTHRWAERDPAAAARLAAARAAIPELAEEHTMPTENLLPPDAVRRVCWEPPDPPGRDAVAAALASYGARPWQVELAAEPLAEAFTDLARAEAE